MDYMTHDIIMNSLVKDCDSGLFNVTLTQGWIFHGIQKKNYLTQTL